MSELGFLILSKAWYGGWWVGESPSSHDVLLFETGRVCGAVHAVAAKVGVFNKGET